MSKEKLAQLEAALQRMEKVAVAFSGGVDSTLLLRVARDQLGERVLAVTAISVNMPAHELEEAQSLAKQLGVRQILCPCAVLENVAFQANRPDRCYVCKAMVLDALSGCARKEGYATLIEGTLADDLSGHRPGWQASQERGVRSPLQEAGLSKDEVRKIARELGLANWDKPATACLATRIPYGTPITHERLQRVEQAEATLRSLGCRQLRVRDHDTVARIEVEPDAFATLLTQRQQVVAALQALGYKHVALDLAGFRSGSMNA